MTTLISKSRQIQVFNLTRDIAPRRMILERRTETSDGGFARHDKRIVVPDSITLLAGARLENLHPAVVRAPEVVAAIQRGSVIVVEDAVVEKKTVAEPTEPEAVAAPKSRGARG